LIADDLALMSNISTDEIHARAGSALLRRNVGPVVFVGMRDGAVKKDEVKWRLRSSRFRFVKRLWFISRDGAYAEKWAGIQLVIAKSIEKIYGQNSQTSPADLD